MTTTSAERTFRAMNTEWWLRASGPGDLDAALRDAEALVHDAEARFSRFLDDSLLAELNRMRIVRDPSFVAIARDALRFVELTRGAFDPTVGAALIASGYDRTFETVQARPLAPSPLAGEGGAPPRPRLVVRGDTVALEGAGTLDLGGIAKGWTVDRVGELLEHRGVRNYLLDGGGDIRAHGLDGDAPWTVDVGEGLVVALHDGAVATSSTLRRRWRTAEGKVHHIITPESGRASTSGFVTATVVASDATTADVLATAIIADPDRGLAALAHFEAEALLLRADGAWTMTPGFERHLATARGELTGTRR